MEHTNLVLQVVAAAFGLAGQYFVNQRRIKGFYLFLVSNAALVIFQMLNGFWVFVGLHTVYFIMSAYGIHSWRGGRPISALLRISKTKVPETIERAAL